ncbi:MAG TPA: lipid-binding SYLF domain-containing protein [Bryobacteraceae bacterium]|jgi:lipid-binding SYLF domain-containing protein|nr:lipid-binding SYLF domain-containing protein [Bryobacteraceae bacterium]
MKKALIMMAALGCSSVSMFAINVQERLEDAASAMHEIMDTPDRGIPHDLLNKARCVIIVPSLKKGAFVVGAEYGKGFAVCRSSANGGWGAPAAIVVEGGSFGFQIGGSATDAVMLIMNEHGMRELEKDKFTLGADASIAAGPVGRTTTAGTDVALTAEILSWSRSKGVFAGVALNGASVRPDHAANLELYGSRLSDHEILSGGTQPTPAAHRLIGELDRYSR